ncbi:hypothetical protein AVEN_92279-1 [Araneus ventricosus]|uniref:Uncharacterized protein n=1 Tax=Araneus ventricosus TaxID=182803 RepID=A0A4Y2AKG3_ARAVE|nr:hypothetical protein AVEN_92279-1 [Araneus ventricosus]
MSLQLQAMLRMSPFHVDSRCNQFSPETFLCKQKVEGRPPPRIAATISSLYGCHLLARKMRMELLWLIPICAERRLVPFVGILDIAASTCVDVPLSVAIFGLPDLLTSATESVLLKFLISFATLSWLICVLRVALKVRAT